MLLQLNRFNGEVEEIEVLNSEFANQIFVSFDWEAEWNRFEQAEVAGEECAVPGIALVDNAGRVLTIGPNPDETFWVCYEYTTLRSAFGFALAELPYRQQLDACSPETVQRLMGQHYRAEHGELVAFLPRDEDPV